MAQSCFFLFLLHAIIFLLASSSSSSSSSSIQSSSASTSTSQKDINLIRQTCNQTEYFNLCVASLESDPLSLNADVKGLARIILELVLKKSNQTIQILENMWDIHDHLMFHLLGICIGEYYVSIMEIVEVIKDLDSNNSGDYKFSLENAAGHVTICEQQFGSHGSPVSKQSQKVHDLCLVASAIISTLA